MTDEMIDHIYNLALLTSLIVGTVTFFASYLLYRARRTVSVYRTVVGGLILVAWLTAYLLDPKMRIFGPVGSTAASAIWFGKLWAMKRHPEAFEFPTKEKE